jgi:hypothetical protein
MTKKKGQSELREGCKMSSSFQVVSAPGEMIEKEKRKNIKKKLNDTWLDYENKVWALQT